MKTKTEKILLRIDTELLKEINKIAKDKKIPRSVLIRLLLSQSLKDLLKS